LEQKALICRRREHISQDFHYKSAVFCIPYFSIWKYRNTLCLYICILQAGLKKLFGRAARRGPTSDAPRISLRSALRVTAGGGLTTTNSLLSIFHLCQSLRYHAKESPLLPSLASKPYVRAWGLSLWRRRPGYSATGGEAACACATPRSGTLHVILSF
jgi:hypothetical protein